MKKILVAIKRVVDYNARIRVKPDKVWHGRPVTNLPYWPRLLESYSHQLLASSRRELNQSHVLQSGVELTNVKMSMNPFCEIAVEVSVCAEPTGSISQLGRLASPCCSMLMFTKSHSAGGPEIAGKKACRGGLSSQHGAESMPGAPHKHVACF